MKFSSRYFHPRFLAIFALASFSTGFLGAHGAFAVDRHVAVGQARAAAVELEERQRILEESLAEADAATADAQDFSDAEPVAAAAGELDAVTADASASIGISTSTPLVVVEDTEESPEPEASAEPEVTTTHDSVLLSNDVENATANSVQTETVIDTETLEKAIEGALDDADEARDAKERLEAAAAELDLQAQQIAERTEHLATATVQAKHESQLDALEVAQDGLATINDIVDELLPQLEETVDNADTLDEATSAHQRLQAVLATAYDTTDAESVDAQAAAVAEAEAAFEAAVVAVRDSHTAWVDAQNEKIEAENEAATDAYKAEYNEALAAWSSANEAAVAANSNGWTGRPSGVSGSNGAVSSDSLCELDFASGHYLQCDAAAALERADKAYYEETGQHFSMTDSYRTYASQVTTYARKPGTAAVPGTSNHGWGMAVDMDLASATWLALNGAEYGWVHPTWARPGGSRPEWWHLEYVATSVGSFSAPQKPETIATVPNLFEEAGLGAPEEAESDNED
ncbi:D-alanyl-D-alanine carboxypeptidase family protein [Demequina sp. B12]|uniref:M15 family metallopeptidase n=1 Tax=Demequina sp. B12 TaxID=2992757 RepID=UPI00237AC46A|nr:D-alanyl-D-alanine carboxypeptidase family protein [Demequina sp. B12]MDE0573110.1 D-alanyl-D-alanine carboxypeptidase family protein [Demequina sp. B12]